MMQEGLRRAFAIPERMPVVKTDRWGLSVLFLHLRAINTCG